MSDTSDRILRIVSRVFVSLVAAVAYGIIGYGAGLIFVGWALIGTDVNKGVGMQAALKGGRMGFTVCALVGFVLSYRRTWASEDRKTR